MKLKKKKRGAEVKGHILNGAKRTRRAESKYYKK